MLDSVTRNCYRRGSTPSDRQDPFETQALTENPKNPRSDNHACGSLGLVRDAIRPFGASVKWSRSVTRTPTMRYERLPSMARLRHLDLRFSQKLVSAGRPAGSIYRIVCRLLPPWVVHRPGLDARRPGIRRRDHADRRRNGRQRLIADLLRANPARRLGRVTCLAMIAG